MTTQESLARLKEFLDWCDQASLPDEIPLALTGLEAITGPAPTVSRADLKALWRDATTNRLAMVAADITVQVRQVTEAAIELRNAGVAIQDLATGTAVTDYGQGEEPEYAVVAAVLDWHEQHHAGRVDYCDREPCRVAAEAQGLIEMQDDGVRY